MSRLMSAGKDPRFKLYVLAGVAVFAPMLLRPSASLPWVPVWLGALIAFLSLIGALWVCRKAGMLSASVLVVFVLVVAGAVFGALSGWAG